ncbi:hypothetical protein Plec18170_009709 [Paecilomyces lecythidis]
MSQTVFNENTETNSIFVRMDELEDDVNTIYLLRSENDALCRTIMLHRESNTRDSPDRLLKEAVDILFVLKVIFGEFYTIEDQEKASEVRQFWDERRLRIDR